MQSSTKARLTRELHDLSFDGEGIINAISFKYPLQPISDKIYDLQLNMYLYTANLENNFYKFFM